MLDCRLVLLDDGRPLANSNGVGAVLVGTKCDIAFFHVLNFLIYFVESGLESVHPPSLIRDIIFKLKLVTAVVH